MNLVEKAKKLNYLLDTDPSKAVNEANQLQEDENSQSLKAAIFIDGGAILKNSKVIERGLDIYRELEELYPNNQDIKYNLANGYHALALSRKYEDLSWYQETYLDRLKARKLFYFVANNGATSSDIKSQAYTNLANMHRTSYRWVEAYDFYQQALKFDNKNAVASSGALKILIYSLENGFGNKEFLEKEAGRLITHVKDNIETIKLYAGRNAADSILDEIDNFVVPFKNFKGKEGESKKDHFENFVVENNLTLSLTIQSGLHDNKRWDELHIISVLSKIEDESDVPEIFGMFNMMKSDYILARHLFYDAIYSKFQDSGTYKDTLDYALYGIDISVLTLAQRLALDVLDKIAVASLAYLKISGARSTNFKKAWFKKNTDKNNVAKRLLPKILNEIKSGNTALLALSEISNDIVDIGGYLKGKRDIRNSSTHRFTVLHDMQFNKNKSRSKCVDHFNYEEFKNETLATLKLARSSLIYFVQMVSLKECMIKKSSNDKLIYHLFVPSHEYIRNLDDEDN